VTDLVNELWQAHRHDGLPDVPQETKGELWVLDEVMGGCVEFYLNAGRVLDQSRAGILHDCREDLARILPVLDGQALRYFSRLDTLAGLLLIDDGKRDTGDRTEGAI